MNVADELRGAIDEARAAAEQAKSAVSAAIQRGDTRKRIAAEKRTLKAKKQRLVALGLVAKEIPLLVSENRRLQQALADTAITAPCTEGQCAWFVAIIGKPILGPVKPWDIEPVSAAVIEGKVESIRGWRVGGEYFGATYLPPFAGKEVRITIERRERAGRRQGMGSCGGCADLQARQDEAQTPPAPMDTVRSMLTDIEAAVTRGDGLAVDQGFDEAINALMAMWERYKRETGTWAPAADSQSASVLDAELPDLPNPELVMRIQAEGLLPPMRRA